MHHFKTSLILSNEYYLNNKIEKDNKIYINDNNNNKNYSNDNNDSDINKYLAKIEMESNINAKDKYASGIGILCNIPSKNMKCLLTYNNIINTDFLNQGKKLILYIDNIEKEIDMKINRFKYENEGLIIIEILEIDNIYNFIEIDKFINSRNYTDSNIIAYYLKNDKKIELSNGKVKKYIMIIIYVI